MGDSMEEVKTILRSILTSEKAGIQLRYLDTTIRTVHKAEFLEPELGLCPLPALKACPSLMLSQKKSYRRPPGSYNAGYRPNSLLTRLTQSRPPPASSGDRRRPGYELYHPPQQRGSLGTAAKSPLKSYGWSGQADGASNANHIILSAIKHIRDVTHRGARQTSASGMQAQASTIREHSIAGEAHFSHPAGATCGSADIIHSTYKRLTWSLNGLLRHISRGCSCDVISDELGVGVVQRNRFTESVG
ncbi:hypothetical protein HPB51_014108 [Rhipicephalus microplus]|uniref:Uncharacterized protein n=1 Tax=Rhipicephalus microplus TaxID=6941 RepID=A0A9J6DVF3_RHIMP|nr:hypothetical protein HPB51_014108 [Rhipicephalus microplus]